MATSKVKSGGGKKIGRSKKKLTGQTSPAGLYAKGKITFAEYQRLTGRQKG